MSVEVSYGSIRFKEVLSPEHIYSKVMYPPDDFLREEVVSCA